MVYFLQLEKMANAGKRGTREFNDLAKRVEKLEQVAEAGDKLDEAKANFEDLVNELAESRKQVCGLGFSCCADPQRGPGLMFAAVQGALSLMCCFAAGVHTGGEGWACQGPQCAICG